MKSYEKSSNVILEFINKDCYDILSDLYTTASKKKV